MIKQLIKEWKERKDNLEFFELLESEIKAMQALEEAVEVIEFYKKEDEIFYSIRSMGRLKPCDIKGKAKDFLNKWNKEEK